MLRALFHLRHLHYQKGDIWTDRISTFFEGLDIWWRVYHTQFLILLLCIAIIVFTIQGAIYFRKKSKLLK